MEGFDIRWYNLESAIVVKKYPLLFYFLKDGKSGSAQILSCLKVRNFETNLEIFLSVCLERRSKDGAYALPHNLSKKGV